MNNTDASQALARRGSSGIAARRLAWLEIGAMLFLFCAAHLGGLGCRLFWGEEYQQLVKRQLHSVYRTAMAFDTNLIESTFLKLRYVPLIVFLMWRSRYGWSYFGLVKPKYISDIIIGLGLWLIIMMLDCSVCVVANTRFPNYLPVAVPLDRAVLLLVESCAIGFSEELFGRAYLISRVEALTGAPWKAVLLSVVVFGFLAPIFQELGRRYNFDVMCHCLGHRILS